MIRMQIALPDWVDEEIAARGALRTPEERMRFAIHLATRNVERGTGGPFGAAVFRSGEEIPVAVGVNRVVPSGYAAAHAEVLALSLAQAVVGSFDLGADGASYELVTSTEPCAMCLGAVCWSGVRHLICGARGADAEEVGFDEGPKPERWPLELERRGIRVTRDVLRAQARAALHSYAGGGGEVYSPRAPARALRGPQDE